MSLTLTLIGAIVFIALLRWIEELFLPEWNSNFIDHIWLVFLQLTDPGNLGEDTETHRALKLPGIVACLSGLIIFSALVAVITTALDGAIERLREGHSRVIETGHTLILGWSDRVAEIIRELIEANESETRPCIVILADRQKQEMDDFIKRTFPSTSNTRIVTRAGTSASIEGLQQISAHAAKAAIVLAECRDSDSDEKKIASDAKVIKSVLALEAIDGNLKFPIVTEVFDSRNAALVKDVAPGRVYIVDASEVLAKLIIQTSRTTGLSIVYSELLSFFGGELYFHHSDWNNTPWCDLPYHFIDGIPIGVRSASGSLTIRPPLSYILEDDDEVLILAEDDSTIRFNSTPQTTPVPRNSPTRKVERHIESMLMLVGFIPLAMWIVWRFSLSRLRVPLPDSSMALLLERSYPMLEERLLTMVQLAGGKQKVAGGTEKDEAFDPRLLAQVGNELEPLFPLTNPQKVLDSRPLARSFIGAFFLVLTILLFYLAQTTEVQIWAARNLAFQDVRWPRATRIRIEGFVAGDDGIRLKKVARGGEVNIRVRADLEYELPQRVEIHFATDEGRDRRIGMTRLKGAIPGRDTDQEYEYVFKNIRASTPLAVVAHSNRLFSKSDRIDDLRIDAVESPALVDFWEIRFEPTLPMRWNNSGRPVN